MFIVFTIVFTYVMSKRLNFEIDDETHSDSKKIKDELGVTWEGFIKAANRELADEYDIDL